MLKKCEHPWFKRYLTVVSMWKICKTVQSLCKSNNFSIAVSRINRNENVTERRKRSTDMFPPLTTWPMSWNRVGNFIPYTTVSVSFMRNSLKNIQPHKNLTCATFADFNVAKQKLANNLRNARSLYAWSNKTVMSWLKLLPHRRPFLKLEACFWTWFSSYCYTTWTEYV